MLLSLADKIIIPEMTGVDIKGLNIEVQFIKGLLDTLDIVPEVFRVNYSGKSYKTAGDQFLNKKMSNEMRENYTSLFGGIYDIYSDNISKGREWGKEKTLDTIDKGPCSARDCQDRGIIDSIMYKDDFEKYMSDIKIIKSNDIIIDNTYNYNWKDKKKKNIAIIYAVGGIQSGNSNPGPKGSTVMGDKTIMEAIKTARKDKSIDAIVLRIDSGGGSALASDQMWKEVYNTTVQDSSNIKPFIASMSDVAASGGYYIACQADTIVASPATITGSIGVISIYPNFSQLIKRYGITSDKIKFGKRSDFLSLANRLSNKYEKDIIQKEINSIYSIFKDKVLLGRKNLSEKTNMDLIAMGRVYTGTQALNNEEGSLVDIVGGLDKAIETAMEMLGAKDLTKFHLIEYPKHQSTKDILKTQIDAARTVSIEDIYGSSEINDYIEFLDLVSKDPNQALLPVSIKIK